MKKTFKQFLKDNWDEMVELAEKSTGESYDGREPLLSKDAVIELAKEEWKREKWNENVETCSNCGIEWKKIGKSCPVCYRPAEKHKQLK